MPSQIRDGKVKRARREQKHVNEGEQRLINDLHQQGVDQTRQQFKAKEINRSRCSTTSIVEIKLVVLRARTKSSRAASLPQDFKELYPKPSASSTASSTRSNWLSSSCDSLFLWQGYQDMWVAIVHRLYIIWYSLTTTLFEGVNGCSSLGHYLLCALNRYLRKPLVLLGLFLILTIGVLSTSPIIQVSKSVFYDSSHIRGLEDPSSRNQSDHGFGSLITQADTHDVPIRLTMYRTAMETFENSIEFSNLPSRENLTKAITPFISTLNAGVKQLADFVNKTSQTTYAITEFGEFYIDAIEIKAENIMRIQDIGEKKDRCKDIHQGSQTSLQRFSQYVEPLLDEFISLADSSDGDFSAMIDGLTPIIEILSHDLNVTITKERVQQRWWRFWELRPVPLRVTTEDLSFLRRMKLGISNTWSGSQTLKERFQLLKKQYKEAVKNGSRWKKANRGAPRVEEHPLCDYPGRVSKEFTSIFNVLTNCWDANTQVQSVLGTMDRLEMQKDLEPLHNFLNLAMSDLFQLCHVIYPVTALAIVSTRSTILLLAGEGPFLRVFDHATRELLCSKRALHSQAIHGIQTFCPLDSSPSTISSVRALVWGGRSFCLISLQIHENAEDGYELRLFHVVPETLATDWIHDACFRPESLHKKHDDESFGDVVMLTSHNVLLSFSHVKSRIDSDEISILRPILEVVATGPRSILYSAHLAWLSPWHVLVAAGTVFGEVLLWSSLIDSTSSIASNSASVQLHYTFIGHEGSVFGVRISKEKTPSTSASVPQVQRVLATCSDDRTIRVWDISRLIVDKETTRKSQETARSEYTKVGTGFCNDFHERNVKHSRNQLAVTLAHNSRIWGLCFLSQSEKVHQLLSFGEDTTSQIWELNTDLSVGGSDTMLSPQTHFLHHQSTYGFHVGKSIWGVATHEEPKETYLVSTGGADGRVISYRVNTPDAQHYGYLAPSRWSMADVLSQLKNSHNKISTTLENATQGDSLAKRSYDGLEGHWKIFRSLKSKLTTYPSGNFEGTAVLQKRPPTSQEYDAEYLYIEDGRLETDQKFSMRATRRYVYRYQERADIFSAWFVKPDDGESVDYLFHHLDFQDGDCAEVKQQSKHEVEELRASGHHLCVRDDYDADYTFLSRGAALEEWRVRYDVKGPSKDYVAYAQYTRHESTDNSGHKSITSRALLHSGIPGKEEPVNPQDTDSFKSYVWINEKAFLASTEQGYLLIGTLYLTDMGDTKSDESPHSSPKVTWKQVSQVNGLRSYCVAAKVSGHQATLLGGSDGTLYIYNHGEESIKPMGKLPRKVSSIFVEATKQRESRMQEHPESGSFIIVACCLGSSIAYAFIVELSVRDGSELGGFSMTRQMILELPMNFIVTSSCFIRSKELFILGSRSGAISFHHLGSLLEDTDRVASCLCLRHIHGEDSVTVIKAVPIDVSKTGITGLYILTAGRNGKYAVHHVETHRNADQKVCLNMQTVHVSTPPFGPNIEGAHFDRVTDELLLWGFRSKDFIVWNESKQTEVMTVECGGAHRTWAYTTHDDGNDGGSLVWTKASSCNVLSQKEASHQVFQRGSHGREIKSLAISPALKDCSGRVRRLVATGAEDTTIRICSYDMERSNPTDGGFEGLAVLTTHTTGIQQLKWSSRGNFLFSAAGCEEFFAWRVHSLPYFGIGVVCDSHCPTVTESADLRIMGFDVGDITSEEKTNDGNTKYEFFISMIYNYNPSSCQEEFSILSTGSYTTHCLTQALHISSNSTTYLCTASTDGQLAIWPLPLDIQTHPTSPTTLVLTHRLPIHRSSITSLISLPLTGTTTLLATGTDSNALAFTLLTLPSPNAPTLLLPNAHAAAITGIAYLGPLTSTSSSLTITNHRFVTASNDQRLTAWTVRVDLSREGVEGLEVFKQGSVESCVADVAALEAVGGEGEEGWGVVVVGVGVEIWGVGGGGNFL